MIALLHGDRTLVSLRFFSKETMVKATEFQFGFIHRDLKPANLAVGPVGTPFFRLIHIFDFGLAREYIVTSYTGKTKMRRPRPKAHFRYGSMRNKLCLSMSLIFQEERYDTAL
ncbi:hypothetical protein NECAME_17128 [Necator americanus]|uniref:Protein kinase domain-containing protein n=1 Tax=Necator americanus TaxID=51031 RepID=W2TR20_NECAM|nr:hypothetical protein NECAME_17128 [Necator americanus]ETN84500.1 hypothetical protein NECAME_17128 [Necator americanus]